MSRINRLKSSTGCYHIMLRGVNRQDIFLDDTDRVVFRKAMRRFSEELAIDIFSYCMMDNHVHLLLMAPDGPALFVKKLSSSYVYFFNHKYERVGHLFQDRYKSEAVETENYLLTVLRYILRNPQKAGISAMEEFPWSSWKEMETDDSYPGLHLFCALAGGKRALFTFLKENNDDICLDDTIRRRLTDSAAAEVLCRVGLPDDPAKLIDRPEEEKKRIVRRARDEGLSIRQISRLTGVSRRIIQQM